MTEETVAAPLAGMRDKYEAIEYLDADGKFKKTRGNGDAVALAMLGMDKAAVRAVAKANKLEVADKPNYGLYRLAVGNKLRAMVTAGEPVAIGDIMVKKLDQRVAAPAIRAAADRRRQMEKDKAKAAKAAKEKAAA